MKKFLTPKLLILLSVFFIVMLPAAYCLFTEASASPAVRIITAAEGGSTDDYGYYTIYDNGRKRICLPFTPDDIDLYDESFYMHSFRNEVINTALKTTADRLVSGEISYPADTISAIKAAFAKINAHDIFDFLIFADSGSFFLIAKPNVNWSSPCNLYLWESDTQTLKKLCTLESVDIIGIALP